ncbi:Hypothetical protein POVR1_LOCUS453 [uncultured virus]|nr:Hypothetical protein POVR1_LOCUS453 [uncultured virus]
MARSPRNALAILGPHGAVGGKPDLSEIFEDASDRGRIVSLPRPGLGPGSPQKVNHPSSPREAVPTLTNRVMTSPSSVSTPMPAPNNVMIRGPAALQTRFIHQPTSVPSHRQARSPGASSGASPGRLPNNHRSPVSEPNVVSLQSSPVYRRVTSPPSVLKMPSSSSPVTTPILSPYEGRTINITPKVSSTRSSSVTPTTPVKTPPSPDYQYTLPKPPLEAFNPEIHTRIRPNAPHLQGRDVLTDIKDIEMLLNQSNPQQPRVPDGFEVIKTDLGSYVVPLFRLMDQTTQDRERSTLEARFRILNDSWKHLGLTFDMPDRDEPLENVFVRYKQSVKYVMSRSGSEFYTLLLMFGWAIIEYGACRMGLEASGYTATQLQMYHLYQTSMVEMGESCGFGEGWSPYTKVIVTTVVNAVIFIAMATFLPSGKQYAKQAMGLAAEVITGGNKGAEMGENGVPKPSNPLGGLAGIADVISNVDFKNLDFNKLSNLAGLFGGGGGGSKAPKEKPSAESLARKRKARRAAAEPEL